MQKGVIRDIINNNRQKFGKICFEIMLKTL